MDVHIDQSGMNKKVGEDVSEAELKSMDMATMSLSAHAALDIGGGGVYLSFDTMAIFYLLVKLVLLQHRRVLPWEHHNAIMDLQTKNRAVWDDKKAKHWGLFFQKEGFEAEQIEQLYSASVQGDIEAMRTTFRKVQKQMNRAAKNAPVEEAPLSLDDALGGF